MADDGDDNDKGGGGAGGWAGLFSELTKSFLILRDIFGYAVSGVIFLTVGVVWHSSFLEAASARIDDYDFPLWLEVVVGLAVCYTIGHVMASLAYVVFNVWSTEPIRDVWAKKPKPLKVAAAHKKSQRITGQARIIAVRGQHPELVTEYERQTIMTQLRGTVGTALVAAYFVFCLCSGNSEGRLPGSWLVLVAGAILQLTFLFSAMPHMDELGEATVEAANNAEKADDGARVYDAVFMRDADQDAATVVLTESPGFRITAAPKTLEIEQDAHETTQLGVAFQGKFKAATDFTAESSDKDMITATLTESHLPESGIGSCTLTVKAAAKAEVRSYSVHVSATGAGVRRETTIPVEVTEKGAKK